DAMAPYSTSRSTVAALDVLSPRGGLGDPPNYSRMVDKCSSICSKGLTGLEGPAHYHLNPRCPHYRMAFLFFLPLTDKPFNLKWSKVTSHSIIWSPSFRDTLSQVYSIVMREGKGKFEKLFAVKYLYSSAICTPTLTDIKSRIQATTSSRW
ncbi:hypothetical protein HAX54_001837, partial [Datura stramonium]|nr:hypothetical protein [Datura stramonium]